MELTTALLALLLVAQPGGNYGANATKAPAAAAPAAASALRPKPHDLVAQAVLLPAGTSTKYQDVSLSQVLASAPRRPADRLAVVQAYWKLWRAFAEENIARTQLARLQALPQRIQPGEVEKVLIAAEQASSLAQHEEAKLAILTAQTELCEYLTWNAGATLPRPSDPPHTGTYHTRFETLYQTRTPTERALLINQTLPIYYHTLGAHGTARQAANDMVAAEEDGFFQQQITIEMLFAAWRAQNQQHRELCRVAWEYNNLIAEYAVPFAGEQVETPKLVNMLIRDAARTARRGGPQAELAQPTRDDVLPAGYEDEQPYDGAVGETDPNGEAATQEWDPTIPDANGDYSTDGDFEPAEEESSPASGSGLDETGFPNYQDPDTEVQGDPFQTGGGVSRWRAPRRHVVAKVQAPAVTTAIFARLNPQSATPRQVLEIMLDRTQVADQGQQSVTLTKALGAVAPTRFPELIDAYADAWRAAAIYQADVDALQQIQIAQGALLGRLADPSAPRDMLVLRAAETAYEARVLEREADAWITAKRLGALALPRSPGALALPYDDPPLWASAPAAATEPALVTDALALVSMDAARAASMTDATSDQLAGLTLHAIHRQNEETLRFIERAADAAEKNGRIVLAQLGSQATAASARAALLGQSAAQATRPNSPYRN